ncbi:F-box/kelch-repeat protein [Iris pallida]|uniref:F-box/kelch-repeat protein n=1 Tax=Iris pallida TaxID=29817 RepID=A0AAX6I344_IRIPA|nr:F-box/kelch-repeat protein [Iris pallida]KAJ6847227.1 F-box/kelch-repeat protein [Iris pallida]
MEQQPLADGGTTQDIIPGLPDDLALRCLAKISHGYHGMLECVSKIWRNALRSRDYSNLKATEGWCGNWLFVSTNVESKCQWDAYDPDADRWHPLPRLCRENLEGHSGFSCVSICKRFLVIGGFYVQGIKKQTTNDVTMFDPFMKQWSRVSSMRTMRTDFACAVICGKVYVAGGSNSNCTGGLAAAEVYDPHLDRWEDLPPMPYPLIKCFSISHGNQFHVAGKKESNIEQDSYFIYDPVGQRWQIVTDLWPFSKLSRRYTTVADGLIYTILEDGTIKVIYPNSRDWSTLGVLPAVLLPEHARPLKPFGFYLIGFKWYLYVLGSKILKYDSNTHAFDVVLLNATKCCDPKNMPLEWQDVRPMPRPCGSILGCASMEE